MTGAAVRRRLQLRSVFVVVGLVAASLLIGRLAHADAPDPALASTTGSLVTNADGTKTLSVHGEWSWPTHTSDCNYDGRAVGFAVDWNDPHQAGNPVATVNGTAVDVGVASAGLNPADNAVHSTPASEIPNPGFGGCGTYANPPGYNSGVWGPVTHKYAADVTKFTVCVVTYDVHLSTDGGAPKSTNETTAGGNNHNGDNSVQKNAGTPLGNGCFTKSFATLTTNATKTATLGGSIKDVATLSGTDSATGSITFKVYGPNDATCSGTPAATLAATQAVNGDGNYTSASYTPSSAGTYRWTARYNGDSKNAAIDTACNDANETSTVNAITMTSMQSLLPNDTATLVNGAGAGGTMTFKLFPPSLPGCGGTPAYTEVVQVTNGQATTSNTTFVATTAGTWRWSIKYSGDSTHPAFTARCGSESFTINNGSGA
ncbi:MAG: hypothetical protein QOG53_2612 [Frankiales bacterium]|jgi:hypothetical protein|nr:hypothetical protein [Frankiales bacterium]